MADLPKFLDKNAFRVMGIPSPAQLAIITRGFSPFRNHGLIDSIERVQMLHNGRPTNDLGWRVVGNSGELVVSDRGEVVFWEPDPIWFSILDNKAKSGDRPDLTI